MGLVHAHSQIIIKKTHTQVCTLIHQRRACRATSILENAILEVTCKYVRVRAGLFEEKQMDTHAA